MLDLMLVLGLLGILYRGYVRGFLAGAISLTTVVAATLIGYRLGVPVGSVLRSWTDAGPLLSRWIASGAVFLAILTVGLLAGRRWDLAPSRVRTADRMAGVVLSGTCYAVIAALVLLLAGAAANLSGPAQGLLAGSRLAGFVNGESASISSVANWALGDKFLEAYVRSGRLHGDNPDANDRYYRIDIPSVASRNLVDRPESAQNLFERLNAARIGEGVGTLAWSEPLERAAAGHGREMYREGYLSPDSPVSGTLHDRLRRTGVSYQAASQTLTLSLTLTAVHEALLTSPSNRSVMLDARLIQVGVSVLEGPFGYLVVHVFSG